MKSATLFCAVFLFCAFALATHSFANQPEVPKDPVAIKGSKKTVMFPHANHSKIECVVCHHKVDGKENFQKCATAGCHDNLEEKKGLNRLYFLIQRNRKELKHKTCLECHAKVVAEKPDLKKAMTSCKGSKCHPE